MFENKKQFYFRLESVIEATLKLHSKCPRTQGQRPMVFDLERLLYRTHKSVFAV